jgi:hypothetical protein
VSNTSTTQRERRKAVQVTLLPSVHQEIIDTARGKGIHPGRLVEWAWGVAKTSRKAFGKFSDAASLGRDRNRPDF